MLLLGGILDRQTDRTSSPRTQFGGFLANRRMLAVFAGAAVLLIALAIVLPAACSPTKKSDGVVPVTQNGVVVGADEGSSEEGDAGAEDSVATDNSNATTADAADDATADAAADATATSTPRELWGKGMMPYLYQIDPEWSQTSYSGGTLAKQGCGPTALDMVYIYLTGDTSIDPAGMADFSTQNGYADEGNGSLWSLMTEGAAQLGLYGQSLTVSEDAIRSELEAGKPVICIMNPGTFTQVGHYIVLERVTEDGNIVVHDSNSVGRSMRTWDLGLICSEAAGAWSFSAA